MRAKGWAGLLVWGSFTAFLTEVSCMPTKRQFDMVVLTIILAKPVMGLFNMWAARKLAVDNSGPLPTVLAGATRITNA